MTSVGRKPLTGIPLGSQAVSLKAADRVRFTSTHMLSDASTLPPEPVDNRHANGIVLNPRHVFANQRPPVPMLPRVPNPTKDIPRRLVTVLGHRVVILPLSDLPDSRGLSRREDWTYNVVIDDILESLGDVLTAASPNESLNECVETLLEDFLGRRWILSDTRRRPCTCLSRLQGTSRLGSRSAKDGDGRREKGREQGKNSHFRFRVAW